MDKGLLEQISKHAEDREIDYISATVIGEQQGIVWKSESQLVEFKQAIDMYLKTFEVERLDLIEAKIAKFKGVGKPKVEGIRGGANAKTTEEAEELTHYAADEKQMRKPKSKQNVMKGKGKKKRLKESVKTKKLNEGYDPVNATCRQIERAGYSIKNVVEGVYGGGQDRDDNGGGSELYTIVLGETFGKYKLSIGVELYFENDTVRGEEYFINGHDARAFDIEASFLYSDGEGSIQQLIQTINKIKREGFRDSIDQPF